ncbi:hypothetical protein [Azoarcus sp. DN11]|uniref:hypothetical protein n=1 Tax=Azoarcus sp. DN11 TaxID=356837 RepID=UPI000EB075CA|nr:hypothetical protein [Azoarcus sp. DN11]AYH41797.1 hypothetical protein CDA09_00080 [Azoarcus sp. DN11]
MQMTPADLAYIKGEASAQPADTSEQALERAAENGYIAPGPQRDAFLSGFLAALSNDTDTAD